MSADRWLLVVFLIELAAGIVFVKCAPEPAPVVHRRPHAPEGP